VTERARTLLGTLLGLDPLASLDRTGWALRGVKPCESIADHSFGVALTVLLLVDALRAEGAEVNGEKALRMALVHDAPEAALGDIPMPVKTEALDAALSEVEATLARRLLPERLAEAWSEMEAGESLEARIVKAADKIHLMVKALVYERQRRGDLSDFWDNENNFRDRGLPVAREVFDLLRAERAALSDRAGRPPARGTSSSREE
jgi:putative hydrolase of HD superfamily